MTHTLRCETAKGGVCRCSCKGEKHGIRRDKDGSLVEDEEAMCKFTLPENTEELGNSRKPMNLAKWILEEEDDE